jgi:hypothetical protein
LPTYEESHQEYMRAMGPELGERYHILWNQCALLHMKWDNYVEMFGSDQEQFDVMNGVAPGFFNLVQSTFWEGIILHLCRFADPANVSHRKTMSLEALLALPNSNKVLKLTGLITEARHKIKFAQDWRNRSLAHLDLDYALDQQAKPLAPASRAHVRDAINAIVAVLQSVEMHFTSCEIGFCGTGAREASFVLRELKLISSLRSEREGRLKNGSATEDDLDWKKWN